MRTNEDMLREIEESDEGRGPDPYYSVGPDLAAVAVANLRVKAAELKLDEAVANARQQGQSWQEIGDVLGMTRQGALKHFRKSA